MNLQVTSLAANDITLHILLEPQANGRIWANVPELPNCALERATRDEALEAIQHLLAERLATVEVVPVHISPPANSSSFPAHSWQPFLGLFKDDPYFATIADELWAKRQVEDNAEIAIDWIEPTA
jgi:predicted RNase H-like HicB family nuclease